MSSDVLKKKFGDPKHWQKERIGEILEYAKEKGLDKNYVLTRALARGSSKEVICAIITAARRNPGELMQLKLTSSALLQNRSIENIITHNITTDFQPYIITTMILEGKTIPQDTKPSLVARAAMKAIIKKPDLIPYFTEVINDFLGECEFDDIIKAAISSDEGMKFVLSSIVPKILQEDPFAISILQRIAADPRGKPALMVGSDLRLKCGINCFL